MRDLLDNKERELKTVLLISRRRRKLASKDHDAQIKMREREWDWR